MLKRHVYIGYDPAEHEACKVAAASLRERYSGGDDLRIHWLDGYALMSQGLYKRPTERRDGRLWDVRSAAPMSTSHANARFFLPRLQKGGWALFCDGDVLFRGDVAELFEAADPAYAIMCVQHGGQEGVGEKKGGHRQLPYARKNWSSVMLWNLDHPAHAALTDLLLDEAPGRDLHRFCWLADEFIGALPSEWNYLVGAAPRQDDPKLAHFTLGMPYIPGYENCHFAEEWRAAAARVGELNPPLSGAARPRVEAA